MIEVTGITGRIGGKPADHLLTSGFGVRTVVRDPEKGELWRARGVRWRWPTGPRLGR